jgi:hypothetical protein
VRWIDQAWAGSTDSAMQKQRIHYEDVLNKQIFLQRRKEGKGSGRVIPTISKNRLWEWVRLSSCFGAHTLSQLWDLLCCDSPLSPNLLFFLLHSSQQQHKYPSTFSLTHFEITDHSSSTSPSVSLFIFSPLLSSNSRMRAIATRRDPSLSSHSV